ncbi:PilN domain-containing protein [Legionella cardiaca]|uniref:PilN domain-containing protein n=1 Tax=Legionella cardiaca TaxID=1071983 RepID=A0ABY8AT42_9GAMM|nr:PilN domain-containing protein [Legionella cardiaca]WED43834.1 PilN domain-containing protein [Legionella cardiaca]
MSEINLLPWRTLRRAELKKKLIIISLSSLSFIFILSVILSFYIDRPIKRQLRRNQKLQMEIMNLEGKIQETRKIIESRDLIMNHVKRLHYLQLNPILVIHFLDEILKIIPENICLDSMEMKEGKIVISGRAKFHDDIGLMMHKFGKNKWICNYKITEIRTVGYKNYSKFKLNISMKFYDNKE